MSMERRTSAIPYRKKGAGATPVVTVPTVTTVEYIRTVLALCDHNGFPVVRMPSAEDVAFAKENEQFLPPYYLSWRKGSRRYSHSRSLRIRFYK